MWENKFPKNNWTDYLIEHGNNLQIQHGDVEVVLKKLISDIKVLLEKGRVGGSIDRISLGLIIDKKHFLDKLKKEGILRWSTYLKAKNPVPGIVTHLLNYKSLFQFSSDDLIYIESLKHFEIAYKGMKADYKYIHDTILKYKKRKNVRIGNKTVRVSIIKSLLAINDYLFLNRKYKKRYVIDDEVFDRQNTLEERSDSISFLLSFADDHLQITPEDLLLIDTDFVTSNNLEMLIKAAYRIKAYKDIEISIEFLGYACRINDNVLVVEHKDEEIFKSMELSNIISHGQQETDNYYLQLRIANNPSLSELAKFIHHELKEVVRYIEEPFARYTLVFPVDLIKEICKEEIGYFKEEYQTIAHLTDQLFIPVTEMKDYEIKKGFTLYDLIILNRVFYVLQITFCEKLKEFYSKEKYLIILNSILFQFKKEQIIDWLKDVIQEEKILSYLDIMSWKAGKKMYLDLQYTPIVEKDGFYICSLSVLFHSRTIRNIFPSLSKRGNNFKVYQISHHILIPEQLEREFLKRGFTCFANIKLYFKGPSQREGDIDFLAYKDGVLFIAECKDIIDSVDRFEYRTVLNYLTKAVSQLDYIKSAISDGIYSGELSRRIKTDISKVKEIQYVIVSAARKMDGHSVGGYAVRNVHELLGFLSHGTWEYQIPSDNLLSFNLCDGDEFDTGDLLGFCSSTGPHKKMYDALIGTEFNLSDNVKIKTYGLNIIGGIENLKNSYRFREIQTEKNEE